MTDCSMVQAAAGIPAQMGEEPIREKEQDRLEMHAYALALAEAVRRAALPFTVALQGEWGCGKTSLMNLMRHELCEGQENSYHCIWVDTWEYAFMSSQEDILYKLMADIMSEIMRTGKNGEGEALQKLNDWMKAGGRFLFRVGAGAVANSGDQAFDKFIAELTGEGGVKMLRSKLQEAIKGALASRGIKGFIFFIDDLDRLDPPVAVKILELLKNLFVVENCAFVLAIDYEVVARGLRAKFGEYASRDGREFRQFFDKIIQLPFPMPVQKYQSAELLSGLLEKSMYYTDKEMKQKLDGNESGALRRVVRDDARRSAQQNRGALHVEDMLGQMVRLSTGQNPRSIKRVVNALSLINIMDEQKLEAERMDAVERRMCFGVVCVQIAYPKIYELLLARPDFTKWNLEFARKQGLLRADAETPAASGEGWEQVLSLAVQGQALEGRKTSIAELLRLMAACAEGNGRALGAAMAKILKLAAVTGGEVGEQVEKVGRDDFLLLLGENEGKDEEDAARVLLENLDTHFSNAGQPPLLEFEYDNQGRLEVRVAHAKDAGRRLLLEFTVRKNDEQKTYHVPPVSEMESWGWNPLDVHPDFENEGLWTRLRQGYNSLADEAHQLVI